jgi:hypothetical protein
MRRSLMLVLAAALAVLVFAQAAFAQDDNPTGDDPDEVYDGIYIYDDNPPSGDDLGVATPTATATPMSSATSTPSATPTPTSTPTASATPSATATSSVSASPRADASALPSSGGVDVLSVAAGVLLVGAGIVVAMLMRRTS